MLAVLKASPKLFTDETTAPVLDPGRGRTKPGQFWAYARDDRPWGSTDPPGVVYVYLTNIIARIVNGHPNSQIGDLLPWAYPIQPVLRHVA